jgi:hypothetical protein
LTLAVAVERAKQCIACWLPQRTLPLMLVAWGFAGVLFEGLLISPCLLLLCSFSSSCTKQKKKINLNTTVDILIETSFSSFNSFRPFLVRSYLLVLQPKPLALPIRAPVLLRT